MNEQEVRSKMQKVLDLTANDFSSIRTGRITPALVEDIRVKVYGGTQEMRINELATISTPDNQTLIIDPWDKSIIGEIRQGILSANVGLNPSISGEILRISLPPLTTEDRDKYVKLLSQKIEAGRIMIRQIRGEIMHDIKKAFEGKEISEDERFGREKILQGITDEFTKKIEEMGEHKKAELLRI